MLRDFFLGFIRIHILYHAEIAPVYGVALLAELKHHGYEISPGTLYPLLHRLETSGYLQRDDRLVDGRVRKYYTITDSGRSALETARDRIRELVTEVVYEKSSASPSDRATRT